MMNKAGYDIGFDVGGSHIAGALFSGEEELSRLQTPYPKNEPDKASGIIAQMIEALADAIPEAADKNIRNAAQRAEQQSGGSTTACAC